MVVPDRELLKIVEEYEWEGVDPANINPASIDLRIGPEVVVVDSPWWAFGRVRKRKITMGPKGLVIRPGQMALLHSLEYVRIPEWAAGLLLLKSSRGREGFDHAFSGWFDPGFEGQAVFEVYSPTRSLRVYPGQRFAQLVLLYMAAPPESPYRGNYQGQRGAVGSVWEE